MKLPHPKTWLPLMMLLAATLRAETPPEWTVLAPATAKSLSGTTLTIEADHAIVATGANPALDRYEISTRTDRTGLTGLRVEALPDPARPESGPGRSSNGNFVLTGIDLEAQSVADPTRTEKVRFVAATADFEQANYEVAKVLDALENTGWAVSGGKVGEARTAWFVAEKPFGFPGGTVLHLRLDFASQFRGHGIGRTRLAVTTDALPVTSPAAPATTKLPALTPEPSRPTGPTLPGAPVK